MSDTNEEAGGTPPYGYYRFHGKKVVVQFNAPWLVITAPGEPVMQGEGTAAMPLLVGTLYVGEDNEPLLLEFADPDPANNATLTLAFNADKVDFITHVQEHLIRSA